MSAYHGAQAAGAARARQEEKRKEAEERNARTLQDRRRKARRGCPTGKTILLTEKEAQAELVGTIVRRNSGNQKRKECRWYQCPACGYYHLTSQPLSQHHEKEES